MKIIQSPIVTVICTCYNHGDYVQDAILSVLNQSYQHVQLIIVDNASTDNSLIQIKDLIHSYDQVQLIENSTNIGICKAFNNAVKLAKGKYLIDLSADDILLPHAIELQVSEFENLDESFGMLYSNIEYIDKTGKTFGNTILEKAHPSGKIFKEILKEYTITSPSTIFRKDYFLELGAYNEALAFEDFDFWVRCSFHYNIYFIPDILVKKRIIKTSFSSEFYSNKSDVMLRSTLFTYKWAYLRLKNDEEKEFFNIGIQYYFRQAVIYGHFELAKDYRKIMNENNSINTLLANCLLRFNINLSLVFEFLRTLS